MSDHQVQLVCHPAHPTTRVDGLAVQVTRLGAGVQLRYDLTGNLAQLEIPAARGAERRDELWKHTCFEAFIGAENTDAYVEFNFAPNGDWAAYRFSGYREKAGHLDCSAPAIGMVIDGDRLIISVLIPAPPPDLTEGRLRLGLSAVVEEKDGRRSYWALHHPSNKPDFHHNETFKLSLD